MFRNDLKLLLSRLKPGYNCWEKAFKSVFDKHVPIKEKIIRGNEKPHMKKSLKKAIMKRSRLKNLYNIIKTNVTLPGTLIKSREILSPV